MMNFRQYTRMTKCVIPNNILLTSTDFNYAFYPMRSLKIVQIPNSVTNMASTYSGCWNLTGSLVCGNNVTNMRSTYYMCNNLTGSPVCGNKVTDMSQTYYNCINLTGSPVCGNNVIDMY